MTASGTSMGGAASFAAAAGHILRHRPPHRRSRLLWDYARLRARVAITRGRARPARVRVLGRRMHVDDLAGFTFVFEEVFVRDDYRFETASARPVIVDAGANVGASVLYFKTLHPGATVIAFEPEPGAVELLRRNVKEAGLEGVGVHAVALGGKPGRTALARGRRHARTQGAGEIEVERLSDHIHGDIDLLKLDVEGAESDVIADLARTGKLAAIRQLAIEYHHHLEGEPDSLSKLLAKLEKAGFRYSIAARAPETPDGYQDVLIRARRRDD